ncbi:MAG: ferritin family protein [Candidatus Brocadiia bacterium]
MTALFNAQEIFEIAEQMERNGAKFYRKAAEGATAAGARSLLVSLAEMEDTHERIFAAMRTRFFGEVNDEITVDPDSLAAKYLQALVEGKIFNLRGDPAAKLKGTEKLHDLLTTAIGLERDTIAYYTGIKEIVPEDLGKDKIDAIIREEMSHVTTLTAEIYRLQ